MALVLALVFRSRLRLLPLVVALAAVAVTFGAMALVGAPLTMASIAVLPVLLGLGVDYAIQFQARVEEEDGDAERAVAPGRADDRHRGARDRRRASSCCCSRPCRWCAASARCWWPASCSRCCSRSRPAPRRWRSRCGAGATALLRALAARRRRAGRQRPRRASPRPGRPRRRGRRGGPARRPAAARAGARDRPRAGGVRLGARHADASRLRRRAARAAGPGGACATCRRCSARPASRARST